MLKSTPPHGRTEAHKTTENSRPQKPLPTSGFLLLYYSTEAAASLNMQRQFNKFVIFANIIKNTFARRLSP